MIGGERERELRVDESRDEVKVTGSKGMKERHKQRGNSSNETSCLVCRQYCKR